MPGFGLGFGFHGGGRLSATGYRDTLLSVSPHMLLIADLGTNIDSANPDPGDQIDAWNDCTTNNHHASQATDANQLTLTAANANISNRASLYGDGSADFMSLAAGGGWSASTNHTFIAVVNPISTGNNRYLLDAQTGRLVIGLRRATPANVMIYETDWRESGAATTGWQILEWKLDASATTYTGYRNGTSIGSDNTYNPKTFASTAAIMSHYAGTSSWAEADVATIFYADKLLSTPERATVYGVIETYYGLGYSL